MFTEDCNEIDEAAIVEGRKRVRATAASLTDAQFDAWVADAKRRGARFVLVPDGVIAEYDAPARLTGADRELALAALGGER